MNTMRDKDNKIICQECGKAFDFLAPHLRLAHRMTVPEYRERWAIPLHLPLSSKAHSAQCRHNVLARIQRGEINPSVQLEMMAEARKRSPQKNRSTALHKRAARETAMKTQPWRNSPVVKTVPEKVKQEARQRMQNRKLNGETVTTIAAALHLSVSFLYKLAAAARKS